MRDVEKSEQQSSADAYVIRLLCQKLISPVPLVQKRFRAFYDI